MTERASFDIRVPPADRGATERPGSAAGGFPGFFLWYGTRYVGGKGASMINETLEAFELDDGIPGGAPSSCAAGGPARPSEAGAGNPPRDDETRGPMNNMTPSTRKVGVERGCFPVSEDSAVIGVWVEWKDRSRFLRALRENQKLAQQKKKQCVEEDDTSWSATSAENTSCAATSDIELPEIPDSILEDAFQGGDVEPEFEGELTHHPAVFSGREEWIVSPHGWGGGSGKVYFDYALGHGGVRLGIPNHNFNRII